ncbi:MAG: helix-turn-helix domain-containing protein [Candidatus Heimdallarchaeota archaeon]
MSLKNVESSLLKQIGFSETEQQVYLTILGIGSGSVGEVYLQTGIPLEDIQTTVNDLSSRGYLKKIEGKINRYIAVEPFLKGFLFVEKEFQNDIIGIENSLINVFDSSYEKLILKMDSFKSSITPIYDKISDELRTSNEKLKMDLTNSIYRHADKISGLTEDFDLMLTDGFSKTFLSISNELSNLSNEISIILREESDTATTRLQKFEQLTNQTIQDLLEPLDTSMVEFKATVPGELDAILADHRAEVSALQKGVKETTKTNLKELGMTIKEVEGEFTAVLTGAVSGYSVTINNYKKASHDIINEEKAKVDGVVLKLIEIIGNDIDSLSAESASLKANIDEIASAGVFKKPDPALVKQAKESTDKIDTISQRIKTAYDDALNVYKKGIIAGVQTLIKNNDATLAKQLKEGSAQIKALKTKFSTKWTAIAKQNEKDITDSVKDVFKEINPKVVKLSKGALAKVQTHVESLKTKHAEILVPLRDVIFIDLEDCMENLFLDTTKRLRLHNDSNNKALDTIRYLTDDMKFAFKSQVQDELNKPKIIASDMISEYTSTLDSFLTTLNRDQSATLDTISANAETFLTSLKDSYTTSSNEISNRLAAIIYKVNETKTYLQEITNSVDQIRPVPRPHSMIIYGNQNSMTAVSDMLIRTKSTCTLVVPTLTQDIVDLLIKQISKRVRIRVLADVEPFRDEALIAAMKEQGNITIWAYPTRDFYAVTRDGAEVLLAPVTREGELTSFLTEQDALVRAIQQIISASFMARSKEV